MNEENITNVIEYIQQNSNQTTETLVQSLVSAGYPLDDIKIGLGRLGLSPLSIPGYTPTVQPPQPPTINLLPGRTLLGLVGAVIILIGVYYLGNTKIAGILQSIPFLGRKPQLARPATDTPTNNISLNPTTTPTQNTNSPLAPFKKAFENGTYKLVIHEENELNNTPLDLTYYVENGFIDRYDAMTNNSYIARTTAFYTLDHATKTYAEVASTDFRYGVLVQSLQDSFIIKELLAGEESKVIQWKQLEESSWQATNTASQDYMIISFDMQNLLEKIELYSKKETLKGTYTFSFEPITIDEELLSVPSGYKEVAQIESTP